MKNSHVERIPFKEEGSLSEEAGYAIGKDAVNSQLPVSGCSPHNGLVRTQLRGRQGFRCAVCHRLSATCRTAPACVPSCKAQGVTPYKHCHCKSCVTAQDWLHHHHDHDQKTSNNNPSSPKMPSTVHTGKCRFVVCADMSSMRYHLKLNIERVGCVGKPLAQQQRKYSWRPICTRVRM
eukprot:6204436-Amphidinium_carterae.1